MKKILAAGLCALLLAGCTSPAPKTTETAETPTQTVTVIPLETMEPTEPETVPQAVPDYQVVYNYMIEDSQEYYIFQGLDENKNLSWTVETAHLPCAQLPRICPMGTMEGKFFYCEDGTVKALDTVSGALLWENAEFGGSLPSDSQFILDPRGYLYLCGYSGPNLFVLDTEGHTVHAVKRFDPDFYWPCRIWEENGQLFVHLEGGSPEGKDFSVPMTWLPEAKG